MEKDKVPDCHFFSIPCKKLHNYTMYYSFKVTPQYKHKDWIKGVEEGGNMTAPGKDTCW